MIHQQRLIMRVTLLDEEKEAFGRLTGDKRDGNGTKLIHEAKSQHLGF